MGGHRNKITVNAHLEKCVFLSNFLQLLLVISYAEGKQKFISIIIVYTTM